METGKLIKDLRIKKGMTQEELADRTELSVRTIQRIESGDVDPRAYTLQMIAKALEVEYSMFIQEESDESDEIKQTSETNWIVLLQLSGILPLVFPSMIMWNMKKDKSKKMAEHFRALISFQLIVLGVVIGSIWVYYKVYISTPLIGVLVANALYTIFGTLQIMSGKPFMPPSFIKSARKND